MSRFKNTLTLFLGSLPLLAGRSYAIQGAEVDASKIDKAYEPVSLRPLNYPSDNLFASHRSHSSHSSHASHSSHYSGSGGGYSTSPVQTYTPSNSIYSTSPQAPDQPTPKLNGTDKLRLQIMRVQMALTKLDLYHGRISGELDAATKESLKLFQRVKNLPESGLMTTETLNGLGVMAVQ